MASGLFGIEHSNRPDEQHWTKNCFNSSFPAALANYMMSKNTSAIYAQLAVVEGELKVICTDIPINELYRCGNLQPNELFFDFESKFEPYEQYARDNIDGIDLVIKNLAGDFLAPIEVKLTTLPTSATATKPEAEWGSEIVVRTATTSYCAFSIWDEVKDHAGDIRDIFEDACSDIESWISDYEMTRKTTRLRTAIDTFEREFLAYQRPLVMQVFWKTKGQLAILDDETFDIVVWSNLAFTRLFLDTAEQNKMSRPMRASARMARCLWELSKSGKVRVEDIYRQMTFGQQNDKEVSVPGNRWRRYITTDRTLHPAVSKNAIDDIILPGYLEKLKPERRLDQTLQSFYFLTHNTEE